MKVIKGEKLVYNGNIPYILGCKHYILVDKGTEVTACCDVVVDDKVFKKIVQNKLKDEPKNETEKEEVKKEIKTTTKKATNIEKGEDK